MNVAISSALKSLFAVIHCFGTLSIVLELLVSLDFQSISPFPFKVSSCPSWSGKKFLVKTQEALRLVLCNSASITLVANFAGKDLNNVMPATIHSPADKGTGAHPWGNAHQEIRFTYNVKPSYA